MEYFSALEEILQTPSPSEKIAKFYQFYKEYETNQLSYNTAHRSIVFKEPSFNSYCKVVSALKVPRRRSLATDEDKAILLHAIAHIEYSAIDLALDAAYRFKDLPKEFYDDWLEVAEDEIRHFLMLEELLDSLGYKYGDFGVHSFLFDTSMATQKLVDRMACIPRYLEASGLDANPQIIKRVQKLDSAFATELIKSLYIILDEEIDHVKKGDYWFKYACKLEGIDPSTFYKIVEKYLPGASKKKAFVNVEFRQKAGYSCDEIKVISDEEC
jgi:uncharacterized ferritin-like protein (DUF455 family)